MGVSGHIPVLLEETIDALAVKPGGRYVDGTFGRGGHSRAIAARGGEVLGIDRDDDALASAQGFRVVKGCHGNLERIARENGWDYVDGILLDLGVSSPQLDEAGRGFSFLREGPLDMRMDRSGGVSAADLVNGESAESLERIFRELGEEPQSRRIARAIVNDFVPVMDDRDSFIGIIKSGTILAKLAKDRKQLDYEEIFSAIVT